MGFNSGFKGLIIFQLFSLYSFFSHFLCYVCRDISVGVVTSLRTGNPRVLVSIPYSGKIFFSFPNISDRFWSPLSLVHSGCRERFPRVYGKKGVKLATHSISVYPYSMNWDNTSCTYYSVPSTSISLILHYILLPHLLRPLLSSHSSYILLPALRLGSDLSRYTGRKLAKIKSKCNIIHRWMCFSFSARHKPVRASNNI
jgi:hypothetical protein